MQVRTSKSKGRRAGGESRDNVERSDTDTYCERNVILSDNLIMVWLRSIAISICHSCGQVNNPRQNYSIASLFGVGLSLLSALVLHRVFLSQEKPYLQTFRHGTNPYKGLRARHRVFLKTRWSGAKQAETHWQDPFTSSEAQRGFRSSWGTSGSAEDQVRPSSDEEATR